MSVDDVALAARLLEMKAAGFRPPGLYWLTTRLDQQTMTWAAENSISIIGYQARDDNGHLNALTHIVDACVEYVPADESRPAPVATRRTYEIADGPDDPKELAQLDPETIRKVMSNRLQHILSNCSDDATYEEFEKFCRKYRYPLSRAFYKDEEQEFSRWFDLQLHFPGLGRGNFGEVFHAFDRDGASVAVKIMHESILSDGNMLGGFRRGVRSMRILTEAGVPGVVPIRYEPG